MKSYINHLKTTRSFGETLPKNYKPTMRSSATFPIQYRAGQLDTICTFMGYWLLKRNIENQPKVSTPDPKPSENDPRDEEISDNNSIDVEINEKDKN